MQQADQLYELCCSIMTVRHLGMLGVEEDLWRELVDVLRDNNKLVALTSTTLMLGRGVLGPRALREKLD